MITIITTTHLEMKKDNKLRVGIWPFLLSRQKNYVERGRESKQNKGTIEFHIILGRREVVCCYSHLIKLTTMSPVLDIQLQQLKPALVFLVYLDSGIYLLLSKRAIKEIWLTLIGKSQGWLQYFVGFKQKSWVIMEPCKPQLGNLESEFLKIA